MKIYSSIYIHLVADIAACYTPCSWCICVYIYTCCCCGNFVGKSSQTFGLVTLFRYHIFDLLFLPQLCTRRLPSHLLFTLLLYFLFIFFYISLSSFSFPFPCSSSTLYKTAPVLPSLHLSLIFPFYLLPSPVHPTGFSFCIFPGLLAIFTLPSNKNRTIVRKIFKVTRSINKGNEKPDYIYNFPIDFGTNRNSVFCAKSIRKLVITIKIFVKFKTKQEKISLYIVLNTTITTCNLHSYRNNRIIVLENTGWHIVYKQRLYFRIWISLYISNNAYIKYTIAKYHKYRLYFLYACRYIYICFICI